MSQEGALVRKEYEWPITLMHFSPWVLDILEKIWDFDVAALGLLGESGAGKSPLGRSVLLAQCRKNRRTYNVQSEPCLRVTTEFDFLRGEVGNLVTGDFLDDGSLSLLQFKLLLSFCDVGLFEAIAWARWGATKWP